MTKFHVLKKHASKVMQSTLNFICLQFQGGAFAAQASVLWPFSKSKSLSVEADDLCSAFCAQLPSKMFLQCPYWQ